MDKVIVTEGLGPTTFLPHCLLNYEGGFACIADLQVVHVDGQDRSHRRLRGRLCISLTACTHRSKRMTTWSLPNVLCWADVQKKKQKPKQQQQQQKKQ